jgi:glucose-1-phosphatase
MTEIKNIIFDLGGIFIEIDYGATRKAFIDLGVLNFDELYQQDYVSALFEDLEVGKINEQEFYHQFRIISKSNLTNEQIKLAWNAMIGSFWIERLEFASLLKKRYNVFLLSNTNIIHQNCFESILNKANATEKYSKSFHQIYYSHQINLRKPNADSYLKIINEHHLVANETLFIDDTLKNIQGAQSIGLQVLHLKPQANFVESVSRILNFPNK